MNKKIIACIIIILLLLVCIPSLLIFRNIYNNCDNDNDSLGSFFKIPTNKCTIQSFSSVMDTNGRIHIIYYDTTHSSIYYLIFDDNAVVVHTIVHRFLINAPFITSLDICLDSMNSPQIIFNDMINGTIQYCYFDVDWNSIFIDEIGFGDGEISITCDQNDRLHIAYTDFSNLCLKYAYFSNLTWYREFIDTSYLVGYNVEIKINNLGKTCILYNDISNKSMRYAVSNGTRWDIDRIDYHDTWTLNNIIYTMDFTHINDNKSIFVYKDNYENNFNIIFLNDTKQDKIIIMTNSSSYGLFPDVESKNNITYCSYTNNNQLLLLLIGNSKITYRPQCTIDSNYTSTRIHVSNRDVIIITLNEKSDLLVMKIM